MLHMEFFDIQLDIQVFFSKIAKIKITVAHERIYVYRVCE